MPAGAAALLSPTILRRLAEHGIQSLNETQERAIPPIIGGRNALLIAPTAGGKTEASVLPLLERTREVTEPGVRVLYVAPLRALLNDIEPRIRYYAEAHGLRAFKWHGDVPAKEKRAAQQNPPDVLLITPESLEVILIGRRSPELLFATVQSILVDEVHYFAGSDRGAHLLAVLARIEDLVDRRLQRVGLSATVGNPDAVLEWLCGDTDGMVIDTSRDSLPSNPRRWEVHVVPSEEIANPLLPILSRPIERSGRNQAPRSIVFNPSRKATEELARQLEEAADENPGVELDLHVHHSSVSRTFREHAESMIRIRETAARSILCTSTLELGIDLGELNLVGQTGEMTSASSFLQRVGRVGRRPGRVQWFVSVNIPGDQGVLERPGWSFVKNLAILNLGARGVVEDVRPPGKAFHILAQQILAITMANHGFRRHRDLEILLNTSSFADIVPAEANQLVDHMLAEDYLRHVPPLLVIGGQAEKEFLPRNALALYSVFDTPPEFTVTDGSNEVGTVNASYVLGLEVPFELRLAGRGWRAIAVSRERGVVRVEPSRAKEPPKWWTTGPGTSRIIVEEMARILSGSPLSDAVKFGDEAEAWLAYLREANDFPNVQPGESLLREPREGMFVVEALGGDRLMNTIALWLSLHGYEAHEKNALHVVVDDTRGGGLTRCAEQLERLTSIDPADLVHEISRRTQDSTYNKFAPCVTPEQRRLHLARNIAAIEDLMGFRVRVESE